MSSPAASSTRILSPPEGIQVTANPMAMGFLGTASSWIAASGKAVVADEAPASSLGTVAVHVRVRMIASTSFDRCGSTNQPFSTVFFFFFPFPISTSTRLAVKPDSVPSKSQIEEATGRRDKRGLIDKEGIIFKLS